MYEEYEKRKVVFIMTTVRKVTMGPDEARELVQIATKCDFDIDISYNGISEELEGFLSRFAMAC